MGIQDNIVAYKSNILPIDEKVIEFIDNEKIGFDSFKLIISLNQ